MTLVTPRSHGSSNQRRVRPPRVLLVGDRKAIDFQAPMRRLDADAERGACVLAAAEHAAGALQEIDAGKAAGLEPPDLLLLAQLAPGQLDAVSVNELRRRVPLAAIVVLTGNWCEGETRSGRPLPGVVHVAWHQFAPRWIRFRDHWEQGRCWDWSYPPTWTEEERLLRGNWPSKNGSDEPLDATLVVASPTAPDHVWLTAVGRTLGYRVVELAADQAVGSHARAIGVWQTDVLDAAVRGDLARFVQQLQPAPVLVLAGFPRPENDAQILSVGAVSLLAKPLLIDDLAAELGWLLEQSCHPAGNPTK